MGSVDVVARATALQPRSDFIQATRFAAAAVVLVTHATFYVHERIDASVTIWHLGEIGVPIFFVISGFVMIVSSVRLDSNLTGAREFITRRLLRIVPLYWLVTTVKAAIALALPAAVLHNHFDILQTIKSFLFIPAFNSVGEVRPIHGVGWTLLHEMLFYLVFAFMMALGVRPALATSVTLFSLFAAGLVSPPITAFEVVATHPVNLYFIVGLSLGSAAVAKRPWMTRGLIGALLVVALLKSMAPATLRGMPLDPAVLLVAGAMLTFASVALPKAFAAPVELGNSSYALYLIHPIAAPPLALAIHFLAPGIGAAWLIALTVALTIGLAHAIHRWVEHPLNRWVEHCMRRQPSRLHSATGVT